MIFFLYVHILQNYILSWYNIWTQMREGKIKGGNLELYKDAVISILIEFKLDFIRNSSNFWILSDTNGIL